MRIDGRLLGIKPEAVAALIVVNSVYQANGQRFRYTCGPEGGHMAGSLHYVGFAFDCGLPVAAKIQDVVAGLKDDLGEDFDVVLESDHIHVEFQPKKRL